MISEFEEDDTSIKRARSCPRAHSKNPQLLSLINLDEDSESLHGQYLVITLLFICCVSVSHGQDFVTDPQNQSVLLTLLFICCVSVSHGQDFDRDISRDR